MVFEVIPAIDLRGGRCVRLTQGDYDRETVFSDDPAGVARGFCEAGAGTIHVVDLDGAAEGRPMNLETLRAVRRAANVKIQYGGGLRTDEAVEQALEAGADRVVLGTALITRPTWVAVLCETYGHRVVVGIDARDGKVSTDGWRTTSAIPTEEAVDRANDLGVLWALFTDIARDGMLQGPNLEALSNVVSRAQFKVIASGGVTTLDDLPRIRETGAAAVIIGRALYTGAIDLEQALRAAQP
jgi:phosphoribosylformimino-5-aminoimidazole carboxamide ribotide isomerase